MRTLRVVAVVLVAALGVGSAVAVADTGSNTACATTPAHTIAVDGSPVSTTPGDVQCVTAETVTVTVTGQNSTTTSPATTTGPSTPTFASETAYTQTRPAFTPKRTISVSTAAALKTAVANLQAGDLVTATAGFTVSSSAGAPLTINKRLASAAVIDLSGYPVKFVYTGTAEQNAVDIMNVQNVRIYGGDLSTSGTGGACLMWTGSQDSTWWGFVAHDCGADGLRMFTLKPGANGFGPVERNDVEGEIYNFDLHKAWDNHQELCTGIHGANLADGNNAAWDHNRVALYVHDSACEGGGIEFGSAYSTNVPDANTIILDCDNLTFVSTIQTGGNCYQTWGYGVTHTDIRYLHATNLTGHPYWAGGMYSAAGNALASDTVNYGRAANVRQNPRYANEPNWHTKAGTVFQDVAPLP